MPTSLVAPKQKQKVGRLEWDARVLEVRHQRVVGEAERGHVTFGRCHARGLVLTKIHHVAENISTCVEITHIQAGSDWLLF